MEEGGEIRWEGNGGGHEMKITRKTKLTIINFEVFEANRIHFFFLGINSSPFTQTLTNRLKCSWEFVRPGNKESCDSDKKKGPQA